MARISGLHIYPVKGCRGIALDSARLTATGLAFDRHWMVVHPDGRFVTQREFPRLALVGTALDDGSLTLTAPGMDAITIEGDRDGLRVPVLVWGDRCIGIDQGDAIATMLSRHIGGLVRLVRFDPSRQRPSDPEYARDLPAFSEFSDGFAILVISEASLADLNARLSTPLPMNRFRPNVVITDVEAFDEDRMEALTADGIDLRLVKACTRCQVTTTDQATAQVGEEPLRTLEMFRMHPHLGGVAFGQNAVVARGVGTILRVGQTLDEVWNF
jgi:uncharacterized protein YcbX